jgi:hypothetical protein
VRLSLFVATIRQSNRKVDVRITISLNRIVIKEAGSSSVGNNGISLFTLLSIGGLLNRYNPSNCEDELVEADTIRKKVNPTRWL